MITVMIVDDHAIVRQGLEQLFKTSDDIEVLALASNGNEAVALAAEHDPDVILMDLSMPELDGVQATRRIIATGARSRIVVLTSFGEESRVLDALNAGAHGYLLKHIDPDDLLAAVRSAHLGDAPLDPRVGRILLDQRTNGAPRRGELTARELDVLELVRHGLANKQIARRLDISERTVKAHLTSVFQRLGVTDRVQAALWAQTHLPPS
jgi:DNA-binding NarL/FixJ family response regulator